MSHRYETAVRTFHFSSATSPTSTPGAMGKQIESIPKETMDALSRYAWPGNIRELQNLMERAALLSTGPSLRVPLAEILTDPALSAASGGNALEQSEREQIVRALREKQLGCRKCSWSRSSPGPQEDVARLQDAEVGDLSLTPVKRAESLSSDKLLSATRLAAHAGSSSAAATKTDPPHWIRGYVEQRADYCFARLFYIATIVRTPPGTVRRCHSRSVLCRTLRLRP